MAEETAGPCPAPNPEPSVPIAEKVRFLGTPAAYPGRPRAVQVLETHLSWVFLTDREVYKLKKPVSYSILDFSTLRAREVNCREEVRLNRRLAPDSYLGVCAVTIDAAGGLALDGPGEVVDWLVRMRRLPGHRMLDQLIVRGALTPADIDRLGGLLTNFYANLGPADIDAGAYWERFRAQHAFNMSILNRREFALGPERLESISTAIGWFLDHDGELLKTRVRQGRVVEGHGDLRPEHICLDTPPVVIDCLEFNRFLRLVDPFEEIAFLGLECSRLGAGWVGDALRRRMETTLDDHPAEELLAFYTASRACLRAQLALAHLLEPHPRTPELWPVVARVYLRMAEAAIRRFKPLSTP